MATQSMVRAAFGKKGDPFGFWFCRTFIRRFPDHRSEPAARQPESGGEGYFNRLTS
jgi:hypothetical protein